MQRLFAIQVHPVERGLLRHQNQLLDAACHKFSRACHQILHRHTPIASPHRRNHAIGTVFVAALRNLQIGKMPARGDCALRLKFRKPCKCIEIGIKFVFKGRADRFPYGIVRICSENGIHLRNLFLHFILIALRQTACNDQ